MDMYNEIYKEAIESVNKQLDKFNEMGSGWRLEKILEINLKLARYKPIRGGNSFAPTPAGLKEKKAIVNVQNDDQLCFLYSVLAHKHPVKCNHHRVNHYNKYLHTLNYDGIDLPMSVGDIDRFEKKNPGLAINVYGYEKSLVYPRRISNRREGKIINLNMFDNSKWGISLCLDQEP